tara:strand:+ start:242 stop:844 length:603 start_codon:yes stop_codon:yes gene_type:complete
MSDENILKEIRDELRASNTKLDQLTSLLKSQILVSRSLDNINEGQLVDRIVDLHRVRELVAEHSDFPELISRKEKSQQQNLGEEVLALAFFIDPQSDGFQRFQSNQLTFANLRDGLLQRYSESNVSRLMENYVETPLRDVKGENQQALSQLNQEGQSALDCFLSRRPGAKLDKLVLPRNLFICIYMLLSLGGRSEGLRDV